MKKILLGMLAGLFLMTSLAQAQTQSGPQRAKQYTCTSIYAQIFAKKHLADLKYNDRFNKTRGDTSYNGFLTILLLTASAVTGSLPIILVATLTPAMISAIVNAPSKEERVLRLRDETNKQFTRFLGRLQNRISAQITAEEVHEVMQSGFDSGKYCENLPDLASPQQIRRDVKKTLKAKYIIK